MMGVNLKTSGRTLGHVAGVYDILSPIMTFWQEDRLSARAIELLPLGSASRIIDVGCGTGTVAIRIADRLKGRTGSVVIGIDAAPEMIEVARKKATGMINIRFDTALAEALPYERESFDCAISTFFFHHIDFGLKIKALREICRVLKPEGELVVVDVDTPSNLFGALCAWSGYFLFRQEEIRENIQGRLKDAFTSSGFKDWQAVSHHLGYITIFRMRKPA